MQWGTAGWKVTACNTKLMRDKSESVAGVATVQPQNAEWMCQMWRSTLTWYMPSVEVRGRATGAAKDTMASAAELAASRGRCS